MGNGIVVALSLSKSHGLTKHNVESINVLEGLGVEGDVHMGATVKHRSRVKKNPNQPNLRQVHLIHNELIAELNNDGFKVSPGQMAENITTQGIDLLSLPENTLLDIGSDARIKITGLRNPCTQLEGIKNGLMSKLVRKLPDGDLERRAGIMGVIEKSGTIKTGDNIIVHLPSPPQYRLKPV